MPSSQLANILSFGAAGRVDDALAELARLQEEYERKRQEVDQRRVEVQLTLERLIQAKREAHLSLSRVRKLTRGLTVRDRSFAAELPALGDSLADLERVEVSLQAGDVALAAAGGSGAAVSTALGAWALVGAVGTASTGTALSTLSGAAAVKATLAWFGGGSLAAGGAGMAGGALVLGGLVAVPAVALTALFSHLSANKKIAEIKSHGEKLVAEGEKCEKNLVTLRALKERSQELMLALAHAQRGFEHEFDRVATAIRRPWHIRLWAWTRALFGGRRYSDGEVKLIAEVGTAATALARIIDQPVLDERGMPT